MLDVAQSPEEVPTFPTLRVGSMPEGVEPSHRLQPTSYCPGHELASFQFVYIIFSKRQDLSFGPGGHN